MKKTKLIFVIDPMRSWCWGFVPIIEALRKNHSNLYTFSLLLGGLRQTMPWNTQSKSYLKQNWDAIAQKTSQKFNYNVLKQNHFTYNTYPSCKAVISIRELWGEEKAFEYAHKIQEAEILMQEDFKKVRVLGVNSFPSVIKIDTDEEMICMSGYREVEEILNV
ncbi:Thioredoxin [hydrothermal vent metagenome]|uniref:Thioredoxin n=1 Tax=hydrothermal vent metagenome TaxID=652676 RepID=A0A1W1CWV3_9ZZZZ